MNRKQISQYDMLVRVRQFGAAHADRFPDPSLARDTFAAVAQAVEQLEIHTVAKLTAVQGTPTKAKARAALLALAQRVDQTGRVIAAHTPGLDGTFVLPSEPTDQELLSRSRVFLDRVPAVQAQFIAHLLPPAFVADLKAAVAAFEAARQQRQADKDSRLAARRQIDAALDAGIEAAHALDAMVGNTVAGDAVTLAVWASDRRIVYPPKRSGKTATTEAAASPRAASPDAGSAGAVPLPASPGVAAPAASPAPAHVTAQDETEAKVA
jgi:hypothetical protein